MTVKAVQKYSKSSVLSTFRAIISYFCDRKGEKVGPIRIFLLPLHHFLRDKAVLIILFS
jgi:hypothetical protein